VLKIGDGSRGRQDSEKTFFSRREVLDRCRNIRYQAESGDDADPNWTKQQRDRHLAELKNIAVSGDRRWPDGELFSTIADAVAAFKDFETAIAIYEKSLADENAGAPIRALKRLQNLRERHASALARQAKGLPEAERVAVRARHVAAVKSKPGYNDVS
jgi:hypothetical protein